MFASFKEKVCSLLNIKKINKLKYDCIKICFVYLVLGFIWIYISDNAANKIANNNEILLLISTYKGLLYVLSTTVFLYIMLSSLIKRVITTEKELYNSNEKLTSVNEELEAYVQQLTASEEELRSQYDQIIESDNKLKKSEERNNAILKAIPDLLFVVNNEGYFIDCKASQENLLLTPKETFLGKTLWDIMPTEISQIAFEKMQSVLRHGMLEKFEYKLNILNSEKYFELRIVKNNNNEVLAISRDVTDERHNELKLKMNEEKYKTLVSEMHQGLVLFKGNTSKDGKSVNFTLADINESYEKLTGFKLADIKGKTIKEVFPSLDNDLIRKIENVAITGESFHYERYMEQTGKYYESIVYRPKKSQYAVIVTDITERKLADQALKISELNFRNIFENSSDAILIIEDDRVIDCNHAMVSTLGFDSKTNILGKCPYEFYPKKQPDGKLSIEKAKELRELTLEKGKCRFEWWYKNIDGNVFPVDVMLTTIIINGKKVFHSLWRDIKEQKKMEYELEYLSYRDQLTGLYNRRFFEDEIMRLDQEENLPLSIVMADVNGLKLVNDTFGHATGDELLKAVSKVITDGSRREDIVARLAGDEFVMILPKTELYEAEKIIKNIKALASKEKVCSVDISISFGYETKRNMDEKIADILKKAEDHMYKKKLFESPSMRGKTINAIITTLHEKNKREEQHSYRVSELCASMGRALALSEDEIKELKTVGLLHDIGKIAIDENILNKAGKLTDEEWEEIKRHPEIGYRILSTVNDMSEMALYILAHHEKWNGTGYPKGIKEHEIPLQSRIITIVDSYDAMISERSYRSALPEEVAIKELKINSGLQFDPDLVNVFVNKVLNYKE